MDVDRLNAAELMMLRPEDLGWRQDIGALAILDGAGLFDRAGAFRAGAVRDRIRERLPSTPRLRQVIVEPGRGRGGPLWVDAERLELSHHVGVVPLPPGAGELELLDAVERLRAPPFDPGRPRWGMWFLPGLPGGRVGLYLRAHHAIADGIAGVLLFGAFLDAEADVAPGPLPSWSPRRPPTTRDLIADDLGRTARALATPLRRLARPVEAVRSLRAEWRALRETFGHGRAPTTSANRRIGDRRRIVLVRARLGDLAAIGHAHAATVNDVLLTLVAGGYRRLLAHRDEPVGSLTLRATNPVSLHADDPTGEASNLDGMMLVPLPLGISDPIALLASIAAETALRKQHVYRPPSGPLAASRPAQHLLWRHFDRQRWSNAYVANVPGPTVPLSFAGSRLEELFPIVPIMGNLTLGVGAMSYDGRFAITVVADATTCPDVDVFVGGLRSTLDTLTATVPEQERVGRRTP